MLYYKVEGLSIEGWKIKRRKIVHDNISELIIIIKYGNI